MISTTYPPATTALARLDAAITHAGADSIAGMSVKSTRAALATASNVYASQAAAYNHTHASSDPVGDAQADLSALVPGASALASSKHYTLVGADDEALVADAIRFFETLSPPPVAIIALRAATDALAAARRSAASAPAAVPSTGQLDALVALANDASIFLEAL